MFVIDDNKMKLYNFLFDENPKTELLLQYVGLNRTDIPRFRDICVQKDQKKWYIIIFTRTGGQNRQDFTIENQKMKENPFYSHNVDYEHDSTYALWYFKIENCPLIDGVLKTQKLFPWEKMDDLNKRMKIGNITVLEEIRMRRIQELIMYITKSKLDIDIYKNMELWESNKLTAMNITTTGKLIDKKKWQFSSSDVKLRIVLVEWHEYLGGSIHYSTQLEKRYSPWIHIFPELLSGNHFGEDMQAAIQDFTERDYL